MTFTTRKNNEITILKKYFKTCYTITKKVGIFQMKKLYYSAFTYLILGLVSGVVWREVTKILDITENTALGTVHTHVLVLGFIMFLIFLVFEKQYHITNSKRFMSFFIIYHVGVGLSSIMMFVRGILSIQVIRGAMELSTGLNSSVSGMAGIGHMLLTVGFVLFMLTLKDQMFEKKNN